MKSFRDRTAVVTGAAGGIGRATSLALAREGCHLALVDLDPEGLEAVAKEIRTSGRKASTHVADVSDAARMEALAREVAEAHGGIHIVVNNAGVTVGASFEDHSIDDLQWIIGINLLGVVHGCKFFLPHLRRAEEGHIVNVSSMAGFMGLPLQSSYCATKFAVRGLSEALYAELAGTHISVTSIHPGTIRTNLLGSARSGPHDGHQVAQLAAKMRRFGRSPDLVARKIVRAIRKRKLRVIVGAESHLTEWSTRLAPVLSRRLMALAYRRFAPSRADGARG